MQSYKKKSKIQVLLNFSFIIVAEIGYIMYFD